MLAAAWSAAWPNQLVRAAAKSAACLGATCALYNTVPVYAVGTLSEQLAALQAAQEAIDAQDVEWQPVDRFPGSLFREYRRGKEGTAPVESGATVSTEMVVRMKTFRTQKDPGGVRYYSTKIDTPNNELQWTIGDGKLPPALEAGMQGMTKSGLRRIEIPSADVFRARKENQLPLPSASDEEGTRRFSRLFKTDATLIFEVLIKKVSH